MTARLRWARSPSQSFIRTGKRWCRRSFSTFVVVAVLLAGEVLIPANKAAVIERLALAVVAIVLLMWWLMYPILLWRTTAYEVTTKRMRCATASSRGTAGTSRLSRITDVSFRKGVLDRLLGSGTLVVESAGEHGELTLREIPHVERVSPPLPAGRG